MRTVARQRTRALVAFVAAALLAMLIFSQGTVVHAANSPILTLSRYIIGSGERIGITAQGFAANETIDITLSNDPTSVLITVPCDANGLCTDTFYAPSNVPQGYYVFTATGETSALTAHAPIVINPSLGLAITGAAGTKTEGGPGAKIAVLGSGFLASESVQIYWGSGTAGILEGTVTADAQGSLELIITAPLNVTPGYYPVTAVRAHWPNRVSEKFYIVAPGADVPQVIYGTQWVSFNYVGFQAGETINVTWNANGGQSLATAIAFEAGQGSISFQAPPAARGSYLLTLEGVSSGFTLHYPIKVEPAILLNPNLTNAGNTIEVLGSGYSAHETINVYLQSPSNGAVTATTDSTGGFSVQLPLPETFDLQTNYEVYAENATSTESASAPFSFLFPQLNTDFFVYAGNPDTVSGYGFASNETLNIYWNYQQTGQTLVTTVTSAGDGSFSVTITVPANGDSSQNQVIVAAVGQTSGLVATQTVTEQQF